MASCSSPWSPFSGVGVSCLTSYLSISHLSLSESGLTLGYGPRHAAPSAVAAQQHAAAPGDSIRRQHLTPPPPPSSTPSCMPGGILLEWTDRRHPLRLRRLAPRDSSPLPLTWLVVYCNSVCTTQHLARLRSTLLGCMDCTSFQLQPQLIAPVVWLFLLAWTPNNLQRLVPCTLLSLRGSL